MLLPCAWFSWIYFYCLTTRKHLILHSNTESHTYIHRSEKKKRYNLFRDDITWPNKSLVLLSSFYNVEQRSARSSIFAPVLRLWKMHMPYAWLLPIFRRPCKKFLIAFEHRSLHRTYIHRFKKETPFCFVFRDDITSPNRSQSYSNCTVVKFLLPDCGRC
jgi:hypothetical protein